MIGFVFLTFVCLSFMVLYSFLSTLKKREEVVKKFNLDKKKKHLLSVYWKSLDEINKIFDKEFKKCKNCQQVEKLIKWREYKIDKIRDWLNFEMYKLESFIQKQL